MNKEQLKESIDNFFEFMGDGGLIFIIIFVLLLILAIALLLAPLMLYSISSTLTEQQKAIDRIDSHIYAMRVTFSEQVDVLREISQKLGANEVNEVVEVPSEVVEKPAESDVVEECVEASN